MPAFLDRRCPMTIEKLEISEFLSEFNRKG